MVWAQRDLHHLRDQQNFTEKPTSSIGAASIRAHPWSGHSPMRSIRGGLLIRWFADLPIERKLRIVITVPGDGRLRHRDDHARGDEPAARARGLAALCHAHRTRVRRRASSRRSRPATTRPRASRRWTRCGTSRWWAALRSSLPDGRKLATYRRGLDDAARARARSLCKTGRRAGFRRPRLRPGEPASDSLQAGRVIST